MTPDELKKRTKEFALRCLEAVDAMPRSIKGRTIAQQLAASGTSAAANYRAACRARSVKEFIAKIGIAEEEADETGFWLELAWESHCLTQKRLSQLHGEVDEITRILAASRITAQSKLRSRPHRRPAAK